MKQVKAMYRKHTILARKISFDLTFRTVEQPFGILVAFDEGPWVSRSRQSLRGIMALSV